MNSIVYEISVSPINAEHDLFIFDTLYFRYRANSYLLPTRASEQSNVNGWGPCIYI